jgi:hypothetical protein
VVTVESMLTDARRIVSRGRLRKSARVSPGITYHNSFAPERCEPAVTITEQTTPPNRLE